MDIEEEYLVDKTLANKLYRIQQHIEDSIKQNGDISQFKEDVMYVIHFLLERVDTKQLTATELQVKRMEYNINKMQKEKDEEYIGVLKTELEKEYKIMDKIYDFCRRELAFEKRLKREKREPDEFNQGKFYVCENIKAIITNKAEEDIKE